MNLCIKPETIQYTTYTELKSCDPALYSRVELTFWSIVRASTLKAVKGDISFNLCNVSISGFEARLFLLVNHTCECSAEQSYACLLWIKSHCVQWGLLPNKCARHLCESSSENGKWALPLSLLICCSWDQDHLKRTKRRRKASFPLLK